MNKDDTSVRRVAEGRQGPLAGLLIVEMTRTLAGEFTGALLADMGAAVVKIESREGSPTRGRGPAVAGEDSLYFQSENRGKFSVCTPTERFADDQMLMEIVYAADALIEDMGTGGLEKQGLGPQLVQQSDPAACILRISAFGQTGPLATEHGDDRIAQAYSGMHYVTGFTDRPPIPVTIPLAEYWTGTLGAGALLIALLYARQHGRGQVIDLAMYETALRMQEGLVAQYDQGGTVASRAGNQNPTVAPANVYRTKDGGWIALSGAGDQPFARLCRTMGVAELSTDPRFATHEARLANRAAIDEVVRTWIGAHDQAEVAEGFASHGVSGIAVQSVDEIIADPHIHARDAIIQLTTASGRGFLAPGIAPKLSRTPPAHPAPAPKLGEHTQYFRTLTRSSTEKSATTTTAKPGPADGLARDALAGIRVLDLGKWLAAPVAATMLADFGADVIMVELPQAGSPERPVTNNALTFCVTNRNKRSVTMDIRAAPGRAALLDLISVTDVLVENFRPGTLERWGLGPEELRRVNPGLVILRTSGFGQTGPYAGRAAFNPVGLGFGGMTYLGGWPDRAPLRDGVMAGDYSAALFGLFGILCALVRRDRDGQGQVVDTSLFEPALRMSGDMLAVRSVLGVRRERAGGEWPLYPIPFTARAADGRYVAVSEHARERLSRALEELGAAVGHGDDGVCVLARFVESRPAAAAVDVLRRVGLASSVVNSVADIVVDPHVRARGNLTRISHPRLGDVLTQGVVPNLSLTPGKVVGVSPAYGHDNVAILEGLLGYSREQISRVIGETTG